MSAGLSTEERERLNLELRHCAWRAGDLRYKLHADQLGVYEQIQLAFVTFARFVLEIARRWGKTWLFCVIAIEACLRHPNARVVYAAPTLKDLQEFIIPTIEAICADAPPECCPRWDAGTGHWNFPNGAYIHLFGCDDKRKANRGRGAGAIMAIIDEAGFIPMILRYVMRSIIRPQLIHSDGKTLVGSTPAEEPDHDFTAIAERAESRGNYARRTVFDNPLLTAEQISKFIEEDSKDEGLTPEQYKQTDEFRREYMAERVINKLLVVVPEWEEKRGKLIQRVARPEFFDALTWLDFGGADPHAVTFAYWHFHLAKVVVESELLLRDGQNTKELADAIKAEEQRLWGTKLWNGTLRGFDTEEHDRLVASLPNWLIVAIDKKAPQQPWARWADNNLQLVKDLYQLHQLAFIPTAKDDKQLQVNNLRVMIRAEEIIVSPDCVHTDRHLRTTTWLNHKRREYARRAGEHGDCLDTLVYGVRNLTRRNPYPPGWGIKPGERVRGGAPAPGPAAAIAKVLFARPQRRR